MKLETKLKRILGANVPDNVKLMRLYTLAFQLMPNSIQQKSVIIEIDSIILKLNSINQ